MAESSSTPVGPRLAEPWISTGSPNKPVSQRNRVDAEVEKGASTQFGIEQAAAGVVRGPETEIRGQGPGFTYGSLGDQLADMFQ